MRLSSLLLATTAILSTSVTASTVPDLNSSKWLQTLSLTVEQSSQITPSGFSRISLYVPNSAKPSNEVWAVYSTSDTAHMFSAGDTQQTALKLPKNQYYRLLDLATKTSTNWGEFSYDSLGHCFMPVKRLSFNGKSQSIVSICGNKTTLPKVSSSMEKLSSSLELLKEKTKTSGINF